MTDLKDEKEALEKADQTVVSWIGSHARLAAWTGYGLAFLVVVFGLAYCVVR